MLNGDFKGDRAELGKRLGEMRALGRHGGIRYVDDGAAKPVGRRVLKGLPSTRSGEVVPLQNPVNPNSLTKAPDAGGVRSGPRKGGRPRVIEGEPWVLAGVSRRTWERRKKAPGGGSVLKGGVG